MAIQVQDAINNLNQGLTKFASAQAAIQDIRDRMKTRAQVLAPDGQNFKGDGSQKCQDMLNTIIKDTDTAVTMLQSTSKALNDLIDAMHAAQQDLDDIARKEKIARIIELVLLGL